MAAAPACAGEAETAGETIWNRAALLDGQGSPKVALRTHGVTIDGSLTQFYQGLVSGDGNKDWQYGGKGDLIVSVDGARLGLWRGFYAMLHQEWLYGEDVNNQGDGTILPVNTAMGFPRLGGYERDTSIVVTQSFGDAFSISAGKFNLLDLAAKTPIAGGGGEDTFLNTALAAPISGVTPAYLLGSIATLKTDPATFTLMVYDPRNAQDWDVIEDPFSKGTTISLATTVSTQFAGLSGFYGIRGVYSTKEGFDLADIPELLLPPESQGKLTKQGYWYASTSIQQYLYQDSADPRRGWGIFADAGLSDGNPNAVRWHFLGGISGSGPIAGRPLDRWGIGYFYYGFSEELKDGLKLVDVELEDEKGIEAYYNLALTPWMRVTADIQWIDTGRGEREDAIIAGLRSQTKF